MSKVREHMTTHIISASPSDNAHYIAKVMNKKKISAMLIIENDHLVGIVTERDFVSKLVISRKDPKEVKVSEIMSKNIISADPEMHIVKVATLMTDKKIKKLPIIDDGHLVGLITQTDLMKLLCYR